MFGLTRNSGPAEFARAALQSVAYQTQDLYEAMRADWEDDSHHTVTLRVDGGMSASDWTMQSLSDILGAAVDRPGDAGNHRAGRRLAGRDAGRDLPGPNGVCGYLEARPSVLAADAACRAAGGLRPLAARGAGSDWRVTAGAGRGAPACSAAFMECASQLGVAPRYARRFLFC